jgi:heptosyltransferase-2
MTREPRAADNPVLIVGPAWIGDMVMAQSLFKALAGERPGVQIDVLAPAWSAPLLKRMPEVREAIPVPFEHGRLDLSARYRLGRQLAGRGYGQAIVLPRSFKAALVPWFAGVPRRTGYLGELRYGLINDVRSLDRAAMHQMVQRYVALGAEAARALPPKAPRPALRVDAANAARLMARHDLSAREPVVGLMPGAEYGPAKQWPLAYYAELARRLDAEGVRAWIFGSYKERAAADYVVMQAGCGVNLCGKTSIEDAVDLIAQVSLAICNDSGLMHMAAAVGTPLVAIYGSSTPDYTPPLSDRALTLYLRVECSPCFERTCRYGHYRCLRDISVGRVLDEVHKQLRIPRASSNSA